MAAGFTQTDIRSMFIRIIALRIVGGRTVHLLLSGLIYYAVSNKNVLDRICVVTNKNSLLSISLKTAVGIFQIVNNRGVVTQLFLVKLETYIELL